MRSDWKRAELNDLVFLQRGFDITKAQQKPGDIPVVSSSGINSYHSEAKVVGPGVVIGRKGTLGTVHYIESDYWPHDTTLWSKCLRDNHPRFVYYFLKTLRLADFDVGSSNPTLNRNHIHKLPIFIPTVPTQTRIAHILSAYDDLIENNKRRMQLLEEAARQLYREWFVRLRFPGHEHTKITDGLPEGWERKPLGDVVAINERNLPSSFDGEIEYIDISAVTPGAINSTKKYEFKEAPSRARRIVQHGDVIWSCVRPNRKSYAVIWNPSENLIASTGFAVITPRSVPTSFIEQVTITSDFVGHLENNAKGAAYPAVLVSDFERAEIVVPSSSLLKAFDDQVQPKFDLCWNLTLQNQKLRAARDLLLPKLMNGEIEV